MKKVITTMLALIAMAPVHAAGINDLSFGPQHEQAARGTPMDGVVAIVGNDVVTHKEIKRMGNSREALEHLIMQKILLQEAQLRGINISESAVTAALRKQRNIGRRASRSQMRDMLMVQKLKNQVASSEVAISKNEIDTAITGILQELPDRVRLVDVLITTPESASADDLRASNAKTHQVRTMLQKTNGKAVAKQFDGVAYNDLGWVKLSDIPVSFAKALFDAPTKQYLEPITDRDGIHFLRISDRKNSSKQRIPGIPEIDVAHILIKDEGNPKAKSTIDTVYKKLQKGADFSQLAQQYSEDPGSAAQGGSLGWTRPGVMIPDFEVVMNKTKIGSISRPFKTKFGYHILKVSNKRTAKSDNNSQLELMAQQAIFARKAHDAWTRWMMNKRQETYVEILQ